MQAVILAGGLGTRLQPYTFFIPKPMLPLGNKPLLEYLVEWVKQLKNIDEVIICVSYLHRTIEDYFEDGGRFGIKISYARSERPLATAGQLKTAEKMLKDRFLCLYGDSIYDFDLTKMVQEHEESKAFLSMALMKYKTKLKYGFIDTDEQANIVTSWREKPEVEGLINIGCYIMEKEFLDMIPQSSTIGMDKIVKDIISQKKIVKAFTVDSGFIDIGDKRSYLDAYKKYVKKLGSI
ncbi:MAG TPA: nucleotidyltransferase family protein [Nitrososphaeraceae archaeon]|jgi:mannose-1-phosphate guanylyltransferase|nr:nucleotidyltransferase family protein [Nitrososphaeraceae archaeon]